MRKNVGTIDATIRITVGLLGLAYGIGKMSRRPYRAPWLLMTLSAMKVAEGFTRFCPMLYAMGSNTRTEDGMQPMWGKMVSTGDRMAQSMQLPKFAKMASFMRMGGGNEGQKTDLDREEQHQQISHEMEEAALAHGTGVAERKLSPSDQQLEQEIREHITGGALEQGSERRTRHSSHYSHDEYHYPTYS